MTDWRANWPQDRFFGRDGSPITITDWLRRRTAPDYCVVDRWQGASGDYVETVWVGIDVHFGDSQRHSIFETHLEIRGDKHFYRHVTETSARSGHGRAVWFAERGIKCWDEVAVAAGDHWSACVQPTAALDPWPTMTNGSLFLDRDGQRISAAEWVRLRRDPEYSVVDLWRGEGGASVCTYWLGLALAPRPIGDTFARFANQICAFDNCPSADHHYRWATEEDALAAHEKIVHLVENGLKPWKDDTEYAVDGNDVRLA